MDLGGAPLFVLFKNFGISYHFFKNVPKNCQKFTYIFVQTNFVGLIFTKLRKNAKNYSILKLS